jgi:hypothetical protein
MLHTDQAKAGDAKAGIDRWKCGGRCVGAAGHRVVDLAAL